MTGIKRNGAWIMVEGILFDMDGLMIDTEKLLCRFWCEAAALYGFDMKKEHVFGIRSLAAKYAIPHLKGIFGEDFDYAAVRAKRIELMNAYIEQNGIEKKKGLDELLRYIKSHGLKCAVCTATGSDRAQMYLEKIGVYGLFDGLVCGDMIKNGKPAPDIYLEGAKKLGLAPKHCIALEDSPNGICSAYAAGCMAVMVPDLTPPGEELLPKITAVCENLALVSGVIEEINGKGRD
jgi:HAD superfamily hydrolase (TIGR01509 family)